MELSKAENLFVSVLQNMECMSYEQASAILRKCCNCSHNQVTKLIHEFITRDFLRLSDDGNFVIAGGSKSNYQLKLKRSTIEELYVMLDVIVDAGDIQWIRKDISGADFKFITNNVVCRILKINDDDFYKISMLQQDYDTRHESLKKYGDELKEMYYFVFDKTDYEDKIFEKMNTLELTIPNAIVILKDETIDTKPKFDIYGNDNTEQE